MIKKIRRSVIAGSWYPGSQRALQKTIEDYFDRVKERTLAGKVVGLISPHAGYPYSGQVAAHGYKQISGQKYDVVVIISPLHQMAWGRTVIPDATHFETPLGLVPVNEDLVDRLSAEIHVERIRNDTEHSLEIQLPFLQVALKEFTLLPIMVGHGDVYGGEDIADALIGILKDKTSLIVASTDLHHIADYREVRRRDSGVVEALSSFKLKTIRDALSPSDCTVCGRVPVSIVVDVTQKMGATGLIVLSQTNSGDVTGERGAGQYTVGYLSAAIVEE